MAKIGIIQTGRIGDIIIALPIAAKFADRGDTVFWPVEDRYLAFVAAAAPYVTFLPIPHDAERADHAVTLPLEALQEREVDQTFMLYSTLNGLGGYQAENEKIAQFLKIDEYKYAIARVPFSEKWNLKIARNLKREEELFRSLNITRQFICMHRKGSNVTLDIALPAEWKRDYDIIDIDERASSPFDWILTLERASKLMCIDSLFANLVEQLNLQTEKYLALRLPGLNTPVFKNGWTFV